MPYHEIRALGKRDPVEFVRQLHRQHHTFDDVMDDNIPTAKYKPGDVVRLKSGSAQLTVEYIRIVKDSNGHSEWSYHVIWYADYKIYRDTNIPEIVLTDAPPIEEQSPINIHKAMME